jgi:putrescine transport system ATP-binding protein
MDRGRLAQVAMPRQLYEAPTSRWVAEFVGDINVLEGQIESRATPRVSIATDAGTIVAAEPRQELTETAVCVAVRPEKVRLSRRAPASDDGSINRLEGTVMDVDYLGGLTTYRIRLDSGATLRASVANTARLDVDAYNVTQRVVAWFTPDDCMVLDR